jgi:hypothetical protein
MLMKTQDDPRPHAPILYDNGDRKYMEINWIEVLQHAVKLEKILASNDVGVKVSVQLSSKLGNPEKIRADKSPETTFSVHRRHHHSFNKVKCTSDGFSDHFVSKCLV